MSSSYLTPPFAVVAAAARSGPATQKAKPKNKRGVSLFGGGGGGGQVSMGMGGKPSDSTRREG